MVMVLYIRVGYSKGNKWSYIAIIIHVVLCTDTSYYVELGGGEAGRQRSAGGRQRPGGGRGALGGGGEHSCGQRGRFAAVIPSEVVSITAWGAEMQ